MRAWTFLLGGLMVWTVHFFALYAIASIFLTTTLARVLAILVTAACLVALALLLVRVVRRNRSTQMDAWMRAVALCGIGLSAMAIVWQTLPAFFS